MIKNLPRKIYHQFPALKYKNYRLYFFGQLISFTGSWLHGVAHGWLVFQLTHSAFWLGTVSAISALPVLALSLLGGFMVDRFNRKKLLIGTQTASLLCAFILGILTITKLINLPTLLLITFIAGVANAIDNPVTQAFVVDVVGKEDLPSAVGLNSTVFNTGRVLGPATAGFLIAMIGVGNIFLLNAASFLAILISLYFIHIQMQVSKPQEKNPIQAVMEGFHYSRSSSTISLLLMTAGIGAIFCFSQTTIMPIIAENIFHEGSIGLGRLLSSMGVGALIASLIISSQSKKIAPFWFIASGNILFLISSFAFSFTCNIQLACLLLFISGAGLTLQFSSVYSSLQQIVKEEFRGRISSMYVLLFIGFSPVGNIFIGSIASWLGPQIAIRFSALIATVYSISILVYLLKSMKKYNYYLSYLHLQYVFAKAE